jgi:hypothetical protein
LLSLKRRTGKIQSVRLNTSQSIARSTLGSDDRGSGTSITTDRFTGGVEVERLKDAKGEILVVPLDRKALPKLWRDATDTRPITRQLEEATLAAALD